MLMDDNNDIYTLHQIVRTTLIILEDTIIFKIFYIKESQ